MRSGRFTGRIPSRVPVAEGGASAEFHRGARAAIAYAEEPGEDNASTGPTIHHTSTQAGLAVAQLGNSNHNRDQASESDSIMDALRASVPN